MPVGRLWKRITRHSEHSKKEQEKKDKEFVVNGMMMSRAVYFGLQNNLDLLPLPSKGKKKQSDHEVKEINKKLQGQMEEYMKQISHPYYFAEANGFKGLFEAPPKAEEKTSQEFREEQKEVAKVREARMVSKLRAIAEISNEFPEEG